LEPPTQKVQVTQQPQEKKNKRNLKQLIPAFAGSAFFEIFQTFFIALLITGFIYIFIAIPNQVDGRSMEDNFFHGELLLTNKFIQIIGDTDIGKKIEYDYERGDVVILQIPGKPDFIKRIIAEPEDTIMFENNKIIVNDMVLDEKYLAEEYKQHAGFLPHQSLAYIIQGQKIQIPEGKYFVMGDNRPNSQDSRYSSIGLINRSQLKGRVLIRYWPLNRLGIIQRGEYDETPYKRGESN